MTVWYNMIQTTNIRRIMDRLTRQKMMRDLPFETGIEYAVDFIQLLGTPGLYSEKTDIIEVRDWRGLLPCDFEQMIQVRGVEGPSNLPGPVYRASGHSFHMSPNKPLAVNGGEFTYKIDGLVIFTSVKDTKLEIAYRAFMVDDDGFPVLPDNASFLRGLETYIKMKWFESKFEEGTLSQAVMDRVDREYMWAVGDAQREFSRLSLDEAQTLFNSFKTILPRNNEHWKAFFTNGAKEHWKIQ